jgi:hypothetical protein
MRRIKNGFGTGDTLGWNYSTGAEAINLAITLGAVNIYLLGFDLVRIGGKSHWHEHNLTVTGRDSFERFKKGFRELAVEVKARSNASVFNVTDGTSGLDCFGTCDWREFYGLLTAFPPPARYQHPAGPANAAESPVMDREGAFV